MVAFAGDDLDRVSEVRRKDASGADVESWFYSYNPDVFWEGNGGLLAGVTLRHKDAQGDWQTTRRIAYTYYETDDPHGNGTDLKTATVYDSANHALDTEYYRYYVPGEANGYAHGLKYVFNYAAYARLAGSVADAFGAADSEVTRTRHTTTRTTTSTACPSTPSPAPAGPTRAGWAPTRTPIRTATTTTPRSACRTTRTRGRAARSRPCPTATATRPTATT